MNSQFYCWYNYLRQPWIFTGFPDSLVGKESACSAGDLGSIPGSGRSPGEGIGYPLQYSWASLMAQQVKNLPATWETWVRSLGWEDLLEKGKATHCSILAWRLQIVGHNWATFVFTLDLYKVVFLLKVVKSNRTDLCYYMQEWREKKMQKLKGSMHWRVDIVWISLF